MKLTVAYRFGIMLWHGTVSKEHTRTPLGRKPFKKSQSQEISIPCDKWLAYANMTLLEKN